MALPSTVPAVGFFTIVGDRSHETHFARRIGQTFYGMSRYRGWRLCGVQNRRAGAALVVGNHSLRVHLVDQPAGAAA